MIFDEQPCFTADVTQIQAKMAASHKITTQLARRGWGLEIGIDRSAQTALIRSAARHGLEASGSFTYGARTGR